MSNIENTESILDVQDITDRVEFLEETSKLMALLEEDDHEEYAELMALLEEMRGYGGNHQWRGDWYPDYLIRDTYFKEYAQELADDIGAIKSDIGWPYSCIDWDRAARELQMDYTSVEYQGVIYWYR